MTAPAIGSWLGMLFGAEPDGSFVEVRWRLRRGAGMGREFIPLRDPRLAATIVAHGRETDVYVGVAPRAREDGTKAGVDRLDAELAPIFERKDLSLGEKLELAGPAVRRNLAPLARELRGVIDDADLGEHLADGIERGAPMMADAAAAAAPRAALSFVNAFREAGPWGKLLTVAFLAHKLGAFKAVGGLAADQFVTAYGARTRAHRGKYRSMGRGIGGALGAGIILGIPFLVDDIREALGITPGKGALGQYSGKSGWGELKRDTLDLLPGEDSEEKRARKRQGGRTQRRYWESRPFAPFPRAGQSSLAPVAMSPAISHLRAPGGGGPGGVFEINVHTTFEMDSEVVARKVTKHRRLLTDAVEREVSNRVARS